MLHPRLIVIRSSHKISSIIFDTSDEIRNEFVKSIFRTLSLENEILNKEHAHEVK